MSETTISRVRRGEYVNLRSKTIERLLKEYGPLHNSRTSGLGTVLPELPEAGRPNHSWKCAGTQDLLERALADEEPD